MVTIPIAEHGFAMPKGEFCDTLCLRFEWMLNMLSIVSFSTICHKELSDLTASLLSEVCLDVGVEPVLQPLDCEPRQYATANQEVVLGLM